MLFALCHSLRIFLNIHECWNVQRFHEERARGCSGVRFWVLILVPISDLLVVLNSSLNFLVYIIFDKSFQDVLKQYAFLPINRWCKRNSLEDGAGGQSTLGNPRADEHEEMTPCMNNHNTIELSNINPSAKRDT